MAVHHDKTVYGKLASTTQALSEDKIFSMLSELNADANESNDSSPKPVALCKNKKATKRKIKSNK